MFMFLSFSAFVHFTMLRNSVSTEQVFWSRELSSFAWNTKSYWTHFGLCISYPLLYLQICIQRVSFLFCTKKIPPDLAVFIFTYLLSIWWWKLHLFQNPEVTKSSSKRPPLELVLLPSDCKFLSIWNIIKQICDFLFWNLRN